MDLYSINILLLRDFISFIPKILFNILDRVKRKKIMGRNQLLKIYLVL